MSWITVIWSMVASTCLTLAVVHLLVWLQRRKQWAYLLFSLAAVGAAGFSFSEALAMRAETVEGFGLVVRWAHIPFWFMLLSLVGFVRIYLRAGRLWLAWTVCGLRTVSLILNFIFTPNINFRGITSLRHTQFLGESVAVAVGTPNPWMLVGQMSLTFFLVFLVDATITLWRRGERWSMVLLSSAMAFLIAVSLGQYVLSFWGIRPMPFISSLCFLGVVAVMSWEMSREAIRAEQLSKDLSKKEEWLELVADSAGVGLWVWDFKTNLIQASEIARRIYGFPSDEPIPFENFLARLHPGDRDWVVQTTHKCTREGADFHNDYRIVLTDGSTRLINVLAKTFTTPDGVPERMSGISIDITERKQLELELQQKRNELAHVARVSTMGQLASTLAHELNQPLGAILRNAEAGELFLQGPSPDLDELRAILADIRKDDQRAGEVIDRMRGLMKQRKDAKCPLDLNLLTSEVVNLVRPDADKRQVRILLDFDTALPTVFGDQVQLQQVLINLLLNAMDALNDTTQDKRFVTVSMRPVGVMVEVAVGDNGPGIAEEKIPQLFEPFFTTKHKGLGMGLPISRGIIEEHGGRLWAKNNDNGGASFFFSLPVATGGTTT